MVLDQKYPQECRVNAGVPKASVLGPTLFLQYINDLADDVICNIAISIESDLRDIVDWGRKWLVDFDTGKTQQVSFGWSNKTDAIDMKMDGSVLEEKSSFKMLEFTFSSKLDWGSYIISIAKTASKEIGVLIHSMKCLSPEVTLSR